MKEWRRCGCGIAGSGGGGGSSPPYRPPEPSPPVGPEFYTSVFGWTTEDWSDFAGMPYFGVTTGTGPGIDGAILGRPGGENAEVGGPVMGATLTMGVADFDEVAEKITAAGGTVALPKYALPGMAWQGYFHDTENNVFGIHQPDPEAK